MSIASLIKKTEANQKKDVKRIILYGLPKSGKTTLCSTLPNALFLSFERGTKHIPNIDVIDLETPDNPKLLHETLQKIKLIINELKEDKKYKFVVIDSLSSMLPVAKYLGELLYSQTTIGKNWFTEGKQKYGDLINLPMAAGYDYWKKGVDKLYELLESSGKIIVTIAHLKEKAQQDRASTIEIDAPSNISKHLSKESEVIGLVYKAKDNEVMLSFKNYGSVLCGTIIQELQDKEFVVTRRLEDGTIKSHIDELLKYINY